jgi:hypothetical protein
MYGIEYTRHLMPKTALQIRSKFFTAGVELYQDRVVSWAPILHYMEGWSEQRVREYVRMRKWTVEAI